MSPISRSALSRPRKRKTIVDSIPARSGLPKSAESGYKKNRDASVHAAFEPAQLTMHFDGPCEPQNPGGIPVYAFIVSETSTRRVLAQEAGLAGEPWRSDATHDLAEFTAAINA